MNDAASSRHRLASCWIWAVILAAAGLGLLGAAGLHPDNAPDEFMRYNISRFIFENSTLPRGDEAELITSWGFNYSFTPYLPSILAAGFMKLAGLFHATPWLLTVSSRMVSVASVFAAGVFAKKIGELAFDKKGAQFLFVCLSLCLPQVLYLAGYLNNDMLSIALSYGIVFCWIRGMKSGWSWRLCMGFGVLLGMLSITYYFAYPYILCSLFVFMISCYWQSHGCRKSFWQKTLLIAGIAFVIGGWFFIKNALFVPWDFFGFQATELYTRLYARADILEAREPLMGLYERMSLCQMLADFNQTKSWWQSSWQSWLGGFQCLRVFMEDGHYRLLLWLLCPGLFTGAARSLFLAVKKKKETLLLVISLWICALLPVGLSVLYSYYSDYQPQGRYFISNLCAVMFLCTMGWSRIQKWLEKGLEKLTGRAFGIPLCFCLGLAFAFIGCWMYWHYNSQALQKMLPSTLEALKKLYV